MKPRIRWRISAVWSLKGVCLLIIYAQCHREACDASWLRGGNKKCLLPSQTPPTARTPIIYFWTNLRYECEFDETIANREYNQECAYKCIYTRRRSLYYASQAVIIEGRLAEYGMPTRTSQDQLFVYLALESPARNSTRRGLKKFQKNQINFTMTYQRDSDFYAPYDELVPLHATEAEQPGSAVRDPAVIKAVSEKSEGVLAVISHCDTDSRRENLIAELRRYIPIDAFGKCYGRRCDDECMASNIKSHKFIIAMENSICEDYVTEKFFRIKQLIVPIVLRQKDYLRIAPKGSFIAVDQFRSVVHLANHLKMLMNSTKEYMRYFEWTNHYAHGPSRQAESVPESRAMCRLCENLHTKRGFQKTVPDISEWFSAKRRCHSGYADSLFQR